MNQVEVGFLEALTETRRYPALLARLGVRAPHEPGGTQLGLTDVLSDMLEQILPTESPEDLFLRLLEDGEVAAATKLLELEGFERSERVRINRRRAALEQELRQVTDEIMGLMLLLKDVTDPAVIASLERVKRLCNDGHLRATRQGLVIRQLQHEQERLDAAIVRIREEIAREKKQLEQGDGAAQNRDLGLALERLGQLLQSRESLPTAQHMLQLARRAAEGTLNRDDLEKLHRSDALEQRYVHPWSDFERDEMESASSILKFLRADDQEPLFFDEDARQRAQALFGELITRRGELDVGRAFQTLQAFLNISGKAKPVHKEGVGAIYSFSFGAPRVPAFRAQHFQGGLLLVVPRRADASTLPSLLRHLPEHGFPILYYPGKLDKNPKERYRLRVEMPFFDNLDLLRLCEVPDGAREIAFQQVILPRAPLSKVDPWQIGGPVAAEMFRGRQAIIDKLKSSTGGTILFSGRMMGKSSILDRIYQDIEGDQTNPKHRAIKFSSTSADIFRPLVTNLVGLLENSHKHTKYYERQIDSLQLNANLSPKQRNERLTGRLDLIRKLIDKLLEDPEARIYLLIDEADQFATDDARLQREHSIAWLLRDIEFDRKDHFRVIFAGFQSIHDQMISQNGAFANWYDLVQLGSLDEPDARSLIVEPFADFGFDFSSRAVIDRILDFTGSHPLLLQEVCTRLMARMYARRSGDPRDELLTVEAGDVEVVCRDDQLRARLRQVLSLNLNEYPRLKLMVYLILDSCGTGLHSTLQLEEFKLDSLESELINWYGEDFNEYFGEKNIGALLTRLKALGLVKSHGDTYQFVNRTFARMLIEEPSFEQKLLGLYEKVTNPDSGQARRFATLPNEHLERITYNYNRNPKNADRQHDDHARQNIIFVGLPATGRGQIARELFIRPTDKLRGAYMLSGAGCGQMSDVREALKCELGEQRKTPSLADFMVRNQLSTLVLTDADQLARTGQLAVIAQSLNERNCQLFAFGGAPLGRAYMRELLALDFDVIYLERLRPQDLKVWGNERVDNTSDHIVMFDDVTAREVCRVTGGYLPLIRHFTEFVCKNHQSAREYFPSQEDVEKFSARLEPALIEECLLQPLEPAERQVLQGLYEYAAAEDNWKMSADWVKELLLPHLAEKTELSETELYDALAILEMLDLAAANNLDGKKGVTLDQDGPLARLFVGANS